MKDRIEDLAGEGQEEAEFARVLSESLHIGFNETS